MKFIKSIFEFFSTSLEPVTNEEFFFRIHNFKSEAFTQSELDDMNYILTGNKKKYEINQETYWLGKSTTSMSEIYTKRPGSMNPYNEFKELKPNSFIYLEWWIGDKVGFEIFKNEDSWLYMIIYSHSRSYGSGHYIIDIEMEWDKFLEFLNELTS
jgi:hypothetical protein